MVERGQFRQDLFYRLNVVPVWLPPLRARRGDVAELARHFCQLAAERNHKGARELESEALSLLGSQRWPGNVRQLMNFVERLVVLSDGPRISAAAVQMELERPAHFTTDVGAASPDPGAPAPASPSPADAGPSPEAVAPGGDAHLSEIVRDAERAALLRALERCGGNRSDAARALGVSRSTFYAKLKQYGLA
jgi:two-component system response regulator AtoC